MTFLLFWDITQRTVEIPYHILGQPIGPIFKGQEIQEESHDEAKHAELGMVTPKFHPPPTLIT